MRAFHQKRGKISASVEKRVEKTAPLRTAPPTPEGETYCGRVAHRGGAEQLVWHFAQLVWHFACSTVQNNPVLQYTLIISMIMTI